MNANERPGRKKRESGSMHKRVVFADEREHKSLLIRTAMAGK